MSQAVRRAWNGGKATQRFVALSGGVGGAKLALGLAHLLGERLAVIVNTGDDFRHLGLHVSPDVDTALYTLAGVVNPQTGWGRSEETWTFMQALATLGGPAWFRLGDGDLATHVVRTAGLAAGGSLTTITADLARRLGVAAHVLPMSDAPVRTVLDTEMGQLAFQDYFVREQCRPAVKGIAYEGAASAQATPLVVEALTAPDLAGVIICPSNPWLSIDPIMAVQGMASALRARGVPVVAVSPLIAGQAVKGPVAKIMDELAVRRDCRGIAQHYAGLIDGMVIDEQDQALAREMPLPVVAVNTLMLTLDDKIALAKTCMAFCQRLLQEAEGRR
jgi:LPPG:FO 2-phospho-L-lactate transferase